MLLAMSSYQPDAAPRYDVPKGGYTRSWFALIVTEAFWQFLHLICLCAKPYPRPIVGGPDKLNACGF